MFEPWDQDAPGVLALPSGRSIRGRSLRGGLPAGQLPELGLYLLGKEPAPMPWTTRWLRWRDFGLPGDRPAARRSLEEVWAEAAMMRVEICCSGGRGRTGTALACLAVLDGVRPEDAVAYVRRNYDHRAVETPWQRSYVARFMQ